MSFVRMDPPHDDNVIYAGLNDIFDVWPQRIAGAAPPLEEHANFMRLDLTRLTDISSVTRPVLEAHAEAAFVMLHRYHPGPPTLGTWQRSSVTTEVTLVWETPSEAMSLTHSNHKDATEEGAYAIAIAIADASGFKVIGRTYQGSGADWLMIPRTGPQDEFFKLEVSGIAEGGTPEGRLMAKMEQGQRGDLDRPGIAVVVRFQDAQIRSESWR